MAAKLPRTPDEQRLWMIQQLMAEQPNARFEDVPDDTQEQRALLRGLMNVRPAGLASPDFLQVQNAYLAFRLDERGCTSLAELAPLCLPGKGSVAERIYLWQGDITTLGVDAIVNAANSAMEGCFVPGHHCIDNAIHTYAGIQLRYACSQMMAAQGHPEPTGQAKITPAYNLPCRYVLHTVGPIVSGSLTPEHEWQLASCYESCLALATEHELESVAFCCISTGVFCFPPQRAAEIATNTVRTYLEAHPGLRVVFNVYTDADLDIYTEVLGRLVAGLENA